MSNGPITAAALAERGLRVFPLVPRTKIPALDGWKEKASADPLQVLSQGWHNDNGIGVATGDGILAFDDDTGRKGGTPFASMFNVPRTFTVRSANGGLHYYFRTPPGERYGNPVNVLPGIDIRADGGYVVAPGTVIPDGSYEIICDAPIAPLPLELFPLLRVAGERKAPGAEIPRQDMPGAVEVAAAWLRDRAPEGVEGSRDNTAFKVSAKLYNFGCGLDTVREFLEVWNETKCNPPLEDEDLDRLAVSGFKSSEGGVGRDNPGTVFDVRPSEADAALPKLTPADLGITPPVPVPPEKPLFDSVIAWGDDELSEAAIPPRPWIVRGKVIREAVTLIGAPGSTGKSLWALQLAAAVGLGRGEELIGQNVTAAGRVLVINNEDPEDELRRRMAAVARHFNLDRRALRDRVMLLSGAKRKFRIHAGHTGGECHNEELAAFCAAHSIDVVIVDPFVSTHRAQENDNREIDDVMQRYTSLAATQHCAVVIIHHTAKPSVASSDGYAGNVNSIRGASAAKDAARVALTMFPMGEGDEEKYEGMTAPRHMYVRMDDAKANLTVASPAAQWFLKRSVTIANGEELGVLEPVDLRESVGANESLISAIASVEPGVHTLKGVAKKLRGFGEFQNLKEAKLCGMIFAALTAEDTLPDHVTFTPKGKQGGSIQIDRIKQ